MKRLFFLFTLLFGIFFIPSFASAQINFGVDVDTSTGAVSGYAWSEGVGWIDFNGVTFNTGTRNLEGTAQIVQLNNYGADGAVAMQGDCVPSCGGYGVSIDAGDIFRGYAWNNVIGWIEFEHAFGSITQNDATNPSVTGFAWNDNIGWIEMADGLPPPPPPASECDASPYNTCSWAWSDTIGWIYHNSIDHPSVPTFGMNIDQASGVVSGHAWNDILGYVDFTGTSYNPVSGELSGTAEILGWGPGAGDLSLRGSCGAGCTYGVSVAPNGTISGHAWNNTLGYIDFAPALGGVFHDSDRNPSVNGWAWNPAYGWFSFNFVEYDVEFGVNLEDNGNFTGYAWSELGWIDYDPAGPYPSSPQFSAQWNSSNEQVQGWAQILSIDAAGGDGWILMTGDCVGGCGGFGATLAQATGDWSGYAWSDSIGWIAYDHTYGGVHTDFPDSGAATPVLESPVNCAETTDLTPTLDWSDYSALDGSSQAAFEIQVSDNDPFFAPGNLVIDYNSNNPPPAFPGTASQYGIGLSEQLEYNKVYYWRVRVQSDGGDWSDWGVSGPSGESNCLVTPVHAPPTCAFSFLPNPPALDGPTQFTDDSITYGGSFVQEWDWDFGDGTTFTGTDILVHQDPEHTYTTQEDVTITLSITDSSGYQCTIQQQTSVSQSLPEIRRVTPR